jgi:hypothetical protein
MLITLSLYLVGKILFYNLYKTMRERQRGERNRQRKATNHQRGININPKEFKLYAKNIGQEHR